MRVDHALRTSGRPARVVDRDVVVLVLEAVLGLVVAGSGEELVVEKEGIRAVFSRDARGALKLSLEGKNMTKGELKQLGDELVGRVTQQYAYHRIVTELKSRNMAIVEEQDQADPTVKIRVRSL
jgi:hypothetical protein